MNEQEFQAFLLSLQSCTIGAVIQVPNPEQFKSQFYASRRRLRARHIHTLDHFSVRTSPSNPQTEVWVITEQREENGVDLPESPDHPNLSNSKDPLP